MVAGPKKNRVGYLGTLHDQNFTLNNPIILERKRREIISHIGAGYFHPTCVRMSNSPEYKLFEGLKTRQDFASVI
jgi:hypothetical protein